jgi:hypothetical protein
MFRGIFLYLLGGSLAIWGVIELIAGIIAAIAEYTEFADNLGGAIGVFVVALLFAAIRFACAYGCYVYGTGSIEEARDNKHGYEGPSFKDIGK